MSQIFQRSCRDHKAADNIGLNVGIISPIPFLLTIPVNVCHLVVVVELRYCSTGGSFTFSVTHGIHS